MTSAGPNDSTPSPAGSGRRVLLAGAVLAGLAGLGVGWGWRRGESGGKAGAARPPDAAAGFWSQSLDTPSGEPLALASLRGRPLLVNFWATWCPPCIEELPMIDAFQRRQPADGFRVLGIAIDQPSAVRAFLQKTPLGFPVVIGGLNGTELARGLGNQTGALPFSVAFGADGRVTRTHMGKLGADDLAAWQRG